MKTAVILSSMGGPSSPEEVRGFLFNLFNDPAIIRLPFFIRKPLARLISKRREKEAQANYAKIGGRSPILENTKEQAKALEDALRLLGDYRCFVGMSYSKPFIDDAIDQAEREYKPDHYVVVPLYPQFSTTTTLSVIRDTLKKAVPIGCEESVSFIKSFCDRDYFLIAVASLLDEALTKLDKNKPFIVFFSAHGLPESIARKDPYPKQCEMTALKIATRCGLNAGQWLLTYQSRVGPMKWIAPYTEEETIKAARAGKQIIIVPIAFVCEHVETMVELAIDGHEMAQKEGAPFYLVVKTVGTNTGFIQGLAEQIQEINQKQAEKRTISARLP